MLGVVRRELVSATRGTRNEVGRRILLAAAVVFGTAAARGRLLDGSASAAQWKRGLDEAAERAVQGEYQRALAMTKTGKQMLRFKPRFGLAAYLVIAAMHPDISALEVVRLFQFRTGGHHLQCLVGKWSSAGGTTQCRCGAPYEDPAHLFFECAATARARVAMYEALAAALQSVPGGAEALASSRTMSATSQWVWLNQLLDAHNDLYRAVLPAVLRAVTVFIRRVLAAHPLYGGRTVTTPASAGAPTGAAAAAAR